MKINLKEELVGFNGEVLKNQEGVPLTVGEAMANMLIAPRKDGNYEMGKMKLYALAQKCYADDTLEVDEADLKGIRKVIETDAAYAPIVSGKILILLENLRN